LAVGIGQLDVRERRKCLFKKELRSLKNVVLASWQSHQWGSTEPTETSASSLSSSSFGHTNGALRSRLKHQMVESFPSLVVVSYQWGPTEPTETLATHGLGGHFIPHKSDLAIEPIKCD
jgi:hypothetical protein